MSKQIERIEPFDSQKTCAVCCHMKESGECKMYGKTNVIIFNHRLLRCQLFDAGPARP